MSYWMSIEVFDGAGYSGRAWSENFGDGLVETALRSGATDWNWHNHTWGVVFEVCFDDEASWDRYRASLPVQTALDSVPDPVSGLIIYKGRGGSAGWVSPRKPRPLSGAGAAALPLPITKLTFDEDYRLFKTDLERRTLAIQTA
ncbi:MAG: hypothetical protein Q8K63_07920 [Acidimicrobiales bacterium]|nr:hypothetical protein [Acidimicrobiales bacterium]